MERAHEPLVRHDLHSRGVDLWLWNRGRLDVRRKHSVIDRGCRRRELVRDQRRHGRKRRLEHDGGVQQQRCVERRNDLERDQQQRCVELERRHDDA